MNGSSELPTNSNLGQPQSTSNIGADESNVDKKNISPIAPSSARKSIERVRSESMPAALESQKSVKDLNATKDASTDSPSFDSKFAEEKILKPHKPLPNPEVYTLQKRERAQKQLDVIAKAEQISSLIQENQTRDRTGENEKISFKETLKSFVSGNSTKTQKNDAQALEYARDTLSKGGDAQCLRLREKQSELGRAIDPVKKQQIQQEMDSIGASIKEFDESLEILNKSAWAGKLSKVRVGTLDDKTKKEVEKRLDIRDVPERELKALHAEAKELVHSSGFEQNQEKLKGLKEGAQKIIDNKISAIVKNEKTIPTEADKASKSEVARVDSELRGLIALKDLVADPELKKSINNLVKYYLSNENLSKDDVKQISIAAQMIESAVLHEIEMAALPQEFKRIEIQNQSLQLDQIDVKRTGSANNDEKLTVKEQIHNFLGMPTKDEKTVRSFIDTLENADPSLGGKALQIVNRMLDNNKPEQKWVQAVLDKNPELNDRLTELKTRLESNNTEVVPQAKPFNNQLLDPPGNAELQRAFLTSYRGQTVAKLTNDSLSEKGVSEEQRKEIPDSKKLFSYITDQFNDKNTSLYQQQQLMGLVDQWLKDPFIHSGDVQDPEIQRQINELANLASASNSPTLRALGEQLKVSLDEAVKVEAPKAKFQNGTTSIQETIKDIAAGKIKPGSKEYKAAVRDFAASLTAQTASTLTSVTSSEFKDNKWEINDQEMVQDERTREVAPNSYYGNAPNLSKAVKDANALAHFVESSVLAPKGELDQNEKGEWQKQSAKAYEFFVDVQQELLSPDNEVVNLNDAMGILNGLNTARMNKLIPEKAKERLESSKELFDPTQNFKALREQTHSLQSNDQAFIPYVGLCLEDCKLVGRTTQSMSDKLQQQEMAVNAVCDVSQNVVAAASNQALYDLSEIAGSKAKYNDKEIKQLYMQARPDIDSVQTESTGNKKARAAEGFAMIGGSYSEEKAIESADYAYSNPVTGVLGNFDAGGHNNKALFNHQVPIFEAFFSELSDKVKDKEFKSIEEAEEFLKEHVEIYHKKFAQLQSNENIRVNFYGYEYSGPAFLAGMLVNIKGQQHFVKAQMDDCCLCIKKKNGEIKFYPTVVTGGGLGNSEIKRERTQISSIPVEEGDELFIYSDGIGDFTTKKEFTDVINNNQNRGSLLQDFIGKIRSFTSNEGREKTSPAREKEGFIPKLISEKDDDVSISYMKVKEARERKTGWDRFINKFTRASS